MSKVSCATYNKGVGQFKCEGCSQIFCTKHVAEHRHVLSQKVDEIALEYDILQEEIKEDTDHNRRIMSSIDQWEEKSIAKIRQTAQNMREKVKELEETYKKIVREELDQLEKQIKKAREDDDFFENNLRNWSTKLEQLKEVKITSLSRNIKEDQTSALIHQI